MKICKELIETIHNLADEYVGYWETFCNLESPTENKAAVDAASAFICEIAEKHGWVVERHPEPISGDCFCITMNPNAKAAPIALSGHVDTVHPIGSFGSPAVHIEGDIIYGPGVTDCKGGIIAILLAMAALEECHFTRRPVMLLLQSDEENSSRNSHKETINWICERSKDAVAFLNCESCRAGYVTVARKGISRYYLEVTGKAVHASDCPNGVSAIAEAAHKILELEKLKDINGLTCSCGLISGGTAENSVPDKCSFSADIRFMNNEQMLEGDRIISEVAGRSYLPGSSCSFRLSSRRAAMPREKRNLDLLDRMNEIFRAYGLDTYKPATSRGGSDAAEVTIFGTPCIDSLGVRGERIHSVDEYAYITSLAKSAEHLAAVIYSL